MSAEDKKKLADINEEDDEEFDGFVAADEAATRDVSIGDEDEDDEAEYAEYVLDRKLGAVAATLRDLLTVKYAPDDADGEVTEEPVAYTVAAIKDDLESFRDLLEVVNGEDGRVESLGEVVARTNVRLETIGRILFKIHKTLDAVADKLGAQIEKKVK